MPIHISAFFSASISTMPTQLFYLEQTDIAFLRIKLCFILTFAAMYISPDANTYFGHDASQIFGIFFGLNIHHAEPIISFKIN